MDAGIVPVKGLQRAKSRLSGHFDDDTRLALARALLHDTLSLCSSVEALRWWFVSDDDEVLQDATRAGFATLRDDGDGLNPALELATAKVVAAGATSATVVPVDVPLAWRGDLQDLLDTGATSDVVVIPSGRDGGTNALYVAPPDLIPPRFGEGSMKAHMSEAERRGLRCAILALPRIALDIDTIEDVDAYLAWPNRFPSETGALLESLRPRATPA
jgi:2-phospho-L-lactate guanylyltransferase